ncbi:hypothetical protein QTN25_007854 [Entamoeba marina]
MFNPLQFFLLFFSFSFAIQWTQNDEIIQIIYDDESVLNQPGWSVTQTGSFFNFVFEAGCSNTLTLDSGPNYCTKQIELTEDSSLRLFSFAESESTVTLSAISQYFPNGFLLAFTNSRNANSGYETQIEIYDRSFTIQTASDENFNFVYKDNDNPYIFFRII